MNSRRELVMAEIDVERMGQYKHALKGGSLKELLVKNEGTARGLAISVGRSVCWRHYGFCVWEC